MVPPSLGFEVLWHLGIGKTGNTHLLLNYLILEMTPSLLLIFHWRKWVLCSHMDLGRKGSQTWMHSCLFDHPSLWPLKIFVNALLLIHETNSLPLQGSQPRAVFSHFMQLKIQKIGGCIILSSRNGCDSSSPVIMLVSWGRLHHWLKSWPLLAPHPLSGNFAAFAHCGWKLMPTLWHWALLRELLWATGWQ